jgi:hypothetical protein
MPIPGFIYAIFDSFSGDPIIDIKAPKLRYLYRFLGILVLIVLLLQIFGFNPIVEAHKAWLHPGHAFHSLTYKWWPYVQTGWHNTSDWAQNTWNSIYHWVKSLFASNTVVS